MLMVKSLATQGYSCSIRLSFTFSWPPVVEHSDPAEEHQSLRCDFSSTGLSSSGLSLRWTLSPLSFSAFLLHRHWSWQWDELASWKASVPQAISSSSPWRLHLSGQLLSAGAPRPLHRSSNSPGPPFLGQGGGKVAMMHIWLDTKASPVFHQWTVKSAVHRCGVKNHSWSKVNVASPRLSSSLSLSPFLAQGEVRQDTRSFLMDFHGKTKDWPGSRESRITKALSNLHYFSFYVKKV